MKNRLTRHVVQILPLLFLLGAPDARAAVSAAPGEGPPGTSPPVLRPPSRRILGGDEPGAVLRVPGPIEVDRDGAVYYIDTHNARVGKVTPDGRSLWEIDGREWGGEGFLDPRSIALATGLDLYVLDAGRRQIFRVRAGGEIVGVVAGEGLSDPRALAATGTGRLGVYDGETSEVSVRSNAGGVLWAFPPRGFRSRTRIGLRLIGGEEEICLFTRGAKTLRIYHFMGGLKRTWKPAPPGGASVRGGSVDFDDGGRAALLEENRPGLLLYDRLGNPIADLGSVLEAIGCSGRGEIRWRGNTIYVSDPAGGSVFEIAVPPLGARDPR